jgi:hypothetical protein
LGGRGRGIVLSSVVAGSHLNAWMHGEHCESRHPLPRRPSPFFPNAPCRRARPGDLPLLGLSAPTRDPPIPRRTTVFQCQVRGWAAGEVVGLGHSVNPAGRSRCYAVSPSKSTRVSCNWPVAGFGYRRSGSRGWGGRGGELVSRRQSLGHTSTPGCMGSIVNPDTHYPADRPRASPCPWSASTPRRLAPARPRRPSPRPSHPPQDPPDFQCQVRGWACGRGGRLGSLSQSRWQVPLLRGLPVK